MQADSSQHSSVMNAAPPELALRKEQAAAQLLQQRMLPDSPLTLGKFKIDYEIYPALQLSGDFVDVVRLDKQRFAFIVADIAGHGASGAMLTVWLKSFMCRLASHRDCGPAKILELMNTELLALGAERHACVLCGVVDEQSASLTLAAAGAYPRPLVTRAGGQDSGAQEALERSGKALGLFAGTMFREQTFELQPGDRLTVVTDGVFELLGDADLSAKEAHLASAAIARTTNDFWSALNVTPKSGCCDDVTLFQLERLS